MSSEYAIDGLFFEKSNVYSFSVLVLEIVRGKRNRGFCHLDHNPNLLGHVSDVNQDILKYLMSHDFLKKISTFSSPSTFFFCFLFYKMVQIHPGMKTV